MVKLYVKENNQANQALSELWHELDTLGTENININLSIDDIQDTENKSAGYSKDFLLPFTDANNQFFEHYYSLDRYTDNFSPYKAIDCRLEIDGVEVLSGFMNFLEVSKKGEDYFYKVVTYDTVVNLFDALGDKTLSDLDYNDITHMRYTRNSSNVAINNVVNSWTNGVAIDNLGYAATYIELQTASNNVLYPLVASNTFYYPYAQNDYALFDSENCPLSLKLKYIVDKSFDLAGFSYDSNFLTDTAEAYFSKIYFDTTTTGAISVAQGSRAFYSVNPVDNTGSTGYPVSIATSPSFTTQSYTHEQENDSNEFNTGTQTFTASFSGQLEVKQVFRIKNTSGAGRYLYMFITLANNDNVYFNGVFNAASQWVTQQTYTNVELSSMFPVTEGTTVTVKFRAENTGLEIQNISEQGGAAFNPHNQIRFFLRKIDYPALSIPAKVGDIKLVDILKDCFKLFNLVVEDTLIDKQIKIEPFVDYVAGGTTLDWTDKTDFNNAVVKPINIPQSIELKYADDDDDFYLDRYKNLYNTDYGTQLIQFNTDSTKRVKIELEVFAPAYTQEMEQGSLGSFLHIGTDEDGVIRGYENKPRLFFKNGVVTDLQIAGQDIHVHEQSIYISNLTMDSYSTASHYNAQVPNITNSTDSLCFGVVQNTYQPTNQNVVAFKNTLYEKWYRSYFEERYDDTDGLLYVIKIILTPQDIFNFSFANAIKIKEQEYRVNKIKYNSDRNKLSTVELYRL